MLEMFFGTLGRQSVLITDVPVTIVLYPLAGFA